MAKIMNMGPTPELRRSWWEAQDIPLEGVTFAEDGTVSLPESEDQRNKFLSAVLGIVDASGVEKTMVIPSNCHKIRKVEQQLRELSRQVGYRNVITPEQVNSMADDLEMAANNLDPKKGR